MAEVGEKGVCPLFVAADWRECSGFVAHWSDVREFRLPVQWAREACGGDVGFWLWRTGPGVSGPIRP